MKFSLAILAILLVSTIYRGFVWSPSGLDGYLLYLPGVCFLPLLVLQSLIVFRPRKRYFGFLFCSILLYFAWIWPLRYALDTSSQDTDLQLLTLNCHGNAINVAKAASRLREMNPDFICLQEVWTPDQLAGLKAQLPEYEFVGHPDEVQKTYFLYGTFVAWKPSWQGERLAQSPADTVAVILRRGQQSFFLASLHGRKVHAYDPTAVLTTAERQVAQMRELESLYESTDLPVVIGGDFNAPVSGPAFKVVSLRNAFDQAGRGVGASYPASNPYFRIDHVLGSEEVEFRSVETFDAGSDHLGLRVRFGLVS